MKSKIFTQEEIEKAIQIKREENFLASQKGMVPRFVTNGEESGKLGEWAVADCYPVFTTHTRDFEALKFDFLSPNQERIEAKTGRGKNPWQPWFAIQVDHDQFHENDYEILIFCYFEELKKEVFVVGWNYFGVFENNESKRFYKKGEIAMSYGREPKPMFKVDNENGTYLWKADSLETFDSNNPLVRPMKELLAIYGIEEL